MREISLIIGNVDSTLFADYIFWTSHCATQVPRESWPVCTIQDLWADAHDHHKRLIIRTRPSSDPVLGKIAWSRTAEEMAMDIVSLPVYDPTDVRFAQFCLFRRNGLWEQHRLIHETVSEGA